MNFFGEHWMMLEQFHWMRPWWLLACLPAVVIAVLVWRQKRKAAQWQDLVSADLLPYLLDGKTLHNKPWQIAALLSGWVIACIALAGPAWEKRSLPVEKNQNALVIVLDLSPSMLSEDLKPSRLVRARLKILDILRERDDGLTGLLVYAADAHVVTPLSDDISTIRSLIPSLHPDIMPQSGSNIEAAIARALQLLRDAGATRGDLLLITDGVVEEAQAVVNEQLNNSGVRLSVLGAGTTMPAPIPGRRGNFVRDQANNIVTTQLEEQTLRKLAERNGGRYARLTGSADDLEWLLSQPPEINEESNLLQDNFDSWYDRGYWLVFLLLPIVLYCFRRGVLIAVLCIPASLFYASETHAFTWSDLWLTKDQQAQKALEQGDAKAAAETFEDPQWKASAEYRAGNYEAAAEIFAGSDSARTHYNRGNALAKAGKLAEAVTAYDQALERQPDFSHAKDNRELVKKLLEQQSQQDQKGEQDKQDNDQSQGSDQKQPSDQNQNSDQQPGEQNSQDKQEPQNSEQNDQQQSSGDSDQQSQDPAGTPSEPDQQGEPAEEQNPGQQPNSDPEQNPEQENPVGDNETEETDSDTENSEQTAAPEQSDEETGEHSEDGQNTMSEGELQEDDMSDEQRRALEQWLRRVPDDPSGLLREKFRYQYNQQRNERLRGNWPVPDSDSEQRW